MPAQIPQINLLGKNAPDNTVFARMIDWITSYGRYIMVTTELVVLVAFVSRFSLDRKLTDLNEMITQKQEIIEVNQPLETAFRQTQQRIKDANVIIASQAKAYKGLLAVQSTVPAGTYIDSFQISNGKLNMSMVSMSTSSFAQFLTMITSNRNLTNVSVDSIGGKSSGGISYSLTAVVVNDPAPAAK